MKFAKELEQDLVPEWRLKYLDYKQGKKRVKAVGRAAARMNATPKTPAGPNIVPQSRSPYGTINSSLPASQGPSNHKGYNGLQEDISPSANAAKKDPFESLKKTPPMPMPAKNGPEAIDSLYGSFVPTPPMASRRFELPGPAVSPQTPLTPNSAMLAPENAQLDLHHTLSNTVTRNAYEIGESTSPHHRTTFASLRDRLPSQSIRPYVRRMFSIGAPLTPNETTHLDVNMVAVDQVRLKQKEFFDWMDKQLENVETFYAMKEDEAGARLKVLREQLHEMRNRRLQELSEIHRAKATRKDDDRSIFDFSGGRSNGQIDDDDKSPLGSNDNLQIWRRPLGKMIDGSRAKLMKPGPNSEALQSMAVSPEIQAKPAPKESRLGNPGQDYVRRPVNEHEVPYRSAKRKLKRALQEFYRGMELLKSYSLLNRTAFRKINKKYDKAVDAHPPLRYMFEKVNKAHFVQSGDLDLYMHDVEDLYARYFERGNLKVATGKLRSPRSKDSDQSASAFRNGVFIGIGTVFSIQGLIYGTSLLRHTDPAKKEQTSYLLQIYGGYFLALYLFSWFCLACSIWTKNKINYQFVFEFDTRHNLDWRQLSEFPSFLILLLGLFMWLNFSQYGASQMFIYYPVILIFITVVIIFIPAPIIFHRSRRWFVYSHWRLLLAGLYPVEFRDFFLGDMFCSLTYLMSNLELFFCLYAHSWNKPSQCNSTHSRLLGFCSTIPSIWRALQCIRRYYDTRDAFPHLVNCGKYGMSIMFGVTLSLYRIQRSHSMLALFTTFAVVNSIYCIFWDLVMDWSLLQADAKKKFLRDVRGYKNPRWYYLAMCLDPILRFNWIFYSIYTHDLQHSTTASFMVGFSEVTRRGMWTIFRVENEHCSNVARFKASRDIPLPYDIESGSAESLVEPQEGPVLPTGAESTPALRISSTDINRQRSHTSGAADLAEQSSNELRRRPTRTLTKVLADAHTQDFEKKRKPIVEDNAASSRGNQDVEDETLGNTSDEDDEDEDD